MPAVSKSDVPATVSLKRARLADNVSVGLTETQSNNKMEMEVDSLRAELEETKHLLREKTVEVEKSTQLFTMFDQQIREM